MKKFLALIVFFYFLSLFQTSFLVPFNISGKLPNLILVFVIFFVILESPKDNFSFFVAFAGGFYIDIFSSHFLGLSIIFLLLLTLLIKQMGALLTKMTVFWFSLFSFIALITYNAFSQLVFNYSRFFFEFKALLSIEIIYNFIILMIIFCLYSFFKKYVLFLPAKIS